MEALLDHLLITPPSHFTPLKVEGFVAELKRVRWIWFKSLSRHILSPGGKDVKSKIKRNFAFGNSLGFQVQIDDLRLKCCILGEDSKNKSTGRKIAWGPPKIFPTGRCAGQDFLDSCPKDRRVHFVIDETQNSYPASERESLGPRYPLQMVKVNFQG